MRAIVVDQFGPPERLRVGEVANHGGGLTALFANVPACQ
jgi:hypothetical protein